MRCKNFSLWGWLSFLFVLPAHEGEAFAQQGDYGGYHMWSEIMGQWAMGWFEGILMIIFWVSIIVAVVFLIDWHLQNRKGRLVPAPGPRLPKKIF
jgi:uncharacterized membrane protein